MTKPFGVLHHKCHSCYLVMLQPPCYTRAPVIRLAHQKICIIIIYCHHIGCLPLNFTQRNWLIGSYSEWDASNPEWKFPRGCTCFISTTFSSNMRSKAKGLELLVVKTRIYGMYTFHL